MAWFHTFNRLIRSFLWADRPPRIAFGKCCQSAYDCGMAMVDVCLYYWATYLVVINDWLCGGWSDPAYVRELQLVGLDRIMHTLYGGPISASLSEVTQILFHAWRGALRWTGWDKKLCGPAPGWLKRPNSRGLRNGTF